MAKSAVIQTNTPTFPCHHYVSYHMWAIGCPPPKKSLNFVCHWFSLVRWATRTIFSIIGPQTTFCKPFLVLHCNNGEVTKKFGHNFWLGDSFDTRSTCLNCILQDLTRATPLDHTWRAHIRSQICQYGQICQIWYLGHILESLLQSVSCFDFSQYNCSKSLP